MNRTFTRKLLPTVLRESRKGAVRNATVLTGCADPRCNNHLHKQSVEKPGAFTVRVPSGKVTDSVGFLIKAKNDPKNKVIQNTHGDCAALKAVVSALESKNTDGLTRDLKEIYKYTRIMLRQDGGFKKLYDSQKDTESKANVLAQHVVPKMGKDKVKRLQKELGVKISHFHEYQEMQSTPSR